MAARKKASMGKTVEPKGPPKANDFAPATTYPAKAAGLKRGGKAMPMHGAAAHKNLGRVGRKRGGGVGADSSPLTGAANLSNPSAKGDG